MRARVIGEGGNLGLTQRGAPRVLGSAAAACNTDAIDNSGGVDMSDHEVNIKILLDVLVQKRRSSRAATERNRSCCGDDRRRVRAGAGRQRSSQALALTLDGLRSAAALRRATSAFVEDMVGAGLSTATTTPCRRATSCWRARRASAGLPRPLLCVLLGHVKNWAYARVLKTGLPDDPANRHFLASYFPALIQQRFDGQLDRHPLRREIIATGAVNYVVNRPASGCCGRWRAAPTATSGR